MHSVVGLDIGSHTIKIIELAKVHNGYQLVSAGSAPTPPKSLASNVSGDNEALAVAIKQLMKDAGTRTKEVNLSLPESQVFTRVISVPQLSTRELQSAIRWEAEQYIPLPLDQVNIDFTVLRDSKTTGTNTMESVTVPTRR
jgi:type IV pilus assembly protein PilM